MAFQISSQAGIFSYINRFLYSSILNYSKCICTADSCMRRSQHLWLWWRRATSSSSQGFWRLCPGSFIPFIEWWLCHSELSWLDLISEKFYFILCLLPQPARPCNVMLMTCLSRPWLLACYNWPKLLAHHITLKLSFTFIYLLKWTYIWS